MLASCLALVFGIFALAFQPAHATENDDVGSGNGCGFSIFCGFWYWTIQGPRGGVGGAGVCDAGNSACLPPGAVNPGNPGDPCFDNPYTDGCAGGSGAWPSPSPSSVSGGGGGGRGGVRRNR